MLLLSGQFGTAGAVTCASVPCTWYHVQGAYWALFLAFGSCVYPRPSLPPYIFLH